MERVEMTRQVELLESLQGLVISTATHSQFGEIMKLMQEQEVGSRS